MGTTFKTSGERRVEGVTWGALVVWVGVMMALPDEPDGLGLAGAGAILLLSALVQAAAGWEAGLLMWGAGIALLFSGLERLADLEDVPLLAIGVIAFGATIVARALVGERRHRARSLPRAVEHEPPVRSAP